MGEIPGPWREATQHVEIAGAIRKVPPVEGRTIVTDLRGNQSYELVDAKEPPNTGDSERDARITQHREEMLALKARVTEVKKMSDQDPTKPEAIAAVQEEIARINEAARMSPDWWTDAELENWKRSIEAAE